MPVSSSSNLHMHKYVYEKIIFLNQQGYDVLRTDYKYIKTGRLEKYTIYEIF